MFRLKIIYQTLQLSKLSNLKLYGMSLNIPSTTSASSVVQAAQQLSTAVTDQNLFGSETSYPYPYVGTY